MKPAISDEVERTTAGVQVDESFFKALLSLPRPRVSQPIVTRDRRSRHRLLAQGTPAFGSASSERQGASCASLLSLCVLR